MAAKDVVLSDCNHSVKKKSVSNANKEELTKTLGKKKKNAAAMERRKIAASRIASSRGAHSAAHHRGAIRKSRPKSAGPKVSKAESCLSLSYLCSAWQDLRGREPVPDSPRYVHALFSNTVRFTLSDHWRQVEAEQRNNLRRMLLMFDSRACQTFAGLFPEPWGDTYALAAIKHNYTVSNDADGEEPATQFPHACTEACFWEPRGVKRARIELLCYAGCKNEALRLCLFYRRCPVLATDHFIAVSTLHLLYHMGSVKHMLDEMKTFSCHDGFQLIQLMLQNEGSSMHPLVECLTQILLVRDLVGPSTYCCTMSLMSTWCLLHVKQKTRLEDVTRESQKLGALATTSAHLYLLVDVLFKQYGIQLLPLYLILYVHALTIDINNLEYARQVDCRVAVAELETHMAAIYTKLASLLAAEEDLGLARECILTAFSLEPTAERLEQLQKWVEARPPMWSYHHVKRPVPCEGECHCSEKGLCRRDPPVPPWFMTHVPNGILDSNLEGVSRRLLQDLCILVEGPRCRSLSWNMPWEKLCGLCVHYLRTSHALRVEVDDRCIGIEARMRRLGPFSSSHLPSFEIPGSATAAVRKAVDGPLETRFVAAEENRRFVVPPLVIRKSAFDPGFAVVDRTDRSLPVNTATHLRQSETVSDTNFERSAFPRDAPVPHHGPQESKATKGIDATAGDFRAGSSEAAHVVGEPTTDILIGLENYVNCDSLHFGQDLEEPFVNDPNGADVESLLNYKMVPPAGNEESLRSSLENNASNETSNPVSAAAVTSADDLSKLAVSIAGYSTLPPPTEESLDPSALQDFGSRRDRSELRFQVTATALDSRPPATARLPISTALPCPEFRRGTPVQGTLQSISEQLDELSVLSILAAERSHRLRLEEQMCVSETRPSRQKASVEESLPRFNLSERPSSGRQFTQPHSDAAKVSSTSSVPPNPLRGQPMTWGETVVRHSNSVNFPSRQLEHVGRRNYPTLQASGIGKCALRPTAPCLTSAADAKLAMHEYLRLSRPPSSLSVPPSATRPLEQSTPSEDVLRISAELTGLHDAGPLISPATLAEQASAVDGLLRADRHSAESDVRDHQYSSVVDQCKLFQQEDLRFEEAQAVRNLIAQHAVEAPNESLPKPDECVEASRPFAAGGDERNKSTSECGKSDDKLMELLRSFDILPSKEPPSALGSEPQNRPDQTLLPGITFDRLVADTVRELVGSAESPPPPVPITLESLVAETLQGTCSEPTGHLQSTDSVVHPPLALAGMATSGATAATETSRQMDGGFVSETCNWKNPPKVDCGTSAVAAPTVCASEDSVGVTSAPPQAVQPVPPITFHHTYAASSVANVSTHSLPTVVYASHQQPHSALLDHMYGDSRLHHILTVRTPATVSAVPRHVSVTTVPSVVSQVDGVSIVSQHPAVFGGAPAGLQSQPVFVALPQAGEERVVAANQILHTVPFAPTSSQPQFQQVARTLENGSGLILQQGGVLQTQMGLSTIHIGSALGMGLTQLPKPSTVGAHPQILVEAAPASLPPVQIAAASVPTHVIALPMQPVTRPTHHVLTPGAIRPALPPRSVHITFPAGTVQQPTRMVQPAVQPQMPMLQPSLATTFPSPLANQSVRYYVHSVPGAQASAARELPKLVQHVQGKPTSLRVPGCANRGDPRTARHHVARTAAASQPIPAAVTTVHNSVPNFEPQALNTRMVCPSSTTQPGAPLCEFVNPGEGQIARFDLSGAVNRVLGQMTWPTVDPDDGPATPAMEACQRSFFRKDFAPVAEQATNPAFRMPQAEAGTSSPLLEACLGAVVGDRDEMLDSGASPVEIKTKIYLPDKYMFRSVTGPKVILAQRKDRKWVSVRSPHGVLGYRKIDSDCDESKLLQCASDSGRGIIVSTPPPLLPNALSAPSAKIVAAGCTPSPDAVLPPATTAIVSSTTTAAPFPATTNLALNIPLVKKCYSPAMLNHGTNLTPSVSTVATPGRPTASVCPQSSARPAVSSVGLPPMQRSVPSERPIGQPMVSTQAQPVAVGQPAAAVQKRVAQRPVSNSPQVGQPKTAVTIGQQVLALRAKSAVRPAILSQSKVLVIRSQPAGSRMSIADVAKVIQPSHLRQVLIPDRRPPTASWSSCVQPTAAACQQVLSGSVSGLTRASAPAANVSSHVTKPSSQANASPATNLKSGLSTFVSMAKSYLVKNKDRIVQLSPSSTATALSQTAPPGSDEADGSRPKSAPQCVERAPCQRKLDFPPKKAEKAKQQCPMCQKFLSSLHCLRRHLNAVHHVSSDNLIHQGEQPRKSASASHHEKATEEQVDLLVRNILMKSGSLRGTAKSSAVEAPTNSPGARFGRQTMGAEAHSGGQTVKAQLQPSGCAVERKAHFSGQAVEAKLQTSGGAVRVKVHSSAQATEAKLQPSRCAIERKAQSSGPASEAKLQASGYAGQMNVQFGGQASEYELQPSGGAVERKVLSSNGTAAEVNLLTSGPAVERKPQVQAKPPSSGQTVLAKPELSRQATKVKAPSNVQAAKPSIADSEMSVLELLLGPGPHMDDLEPANVSVGQFPVRLKVEGNDSEPTTCRQPQPFVTEGRVESAPKSAVEEATELPELSTEVETPIESSSEEEDEEEEMPLLLPVVALTPIDFDVHYGKELSPPKIEMVAMQPTAESARDSRELRGRASPRTIKPAQKRACPCCENTSPNSSNKRRCANDRTKRGCSPAALRKAAGPKCPRKTRTGRNGKS